MPVRKRKIEMLFKLRNSLDEFFIGLTVSGIDTVISYHFKMFFGNMSDKSFDEIHNREFFNNKFVVFVTVVFKGNKITVIVNDAGSGDNRSAKVSTYVFQNLFRFAFVGFGVNIETVFVFSVAASFNFFERRAELFLHKI